VPLEPAHEVSVDYKLEDGEADRSDDPAERVGAGGPGDQVRQQGLGDRQRAENRTSRPPVGYAHDKLQRESRARGGITNAKTGFPFSRE